MQSKKKSIFLTTRNILMKKISFISIYGANLTAGDISLYFWLEAVMNRLTTHRESSQSDNWRFYSEVAP